MPSVDTKLAHGVQVVEPLPEAKVPAAHGEHVDEPPVVYVPAGHATGSALLLAHDAPAGHDAQLPMAPTTLLYSASPQG